MKKKITIFGSTGSIGESTLDVIRHHPDKYEVVGLTANKNYKKLLEQVEIFKPKVISISDKDSYKHFKNINNYKVEVLNGESSYDEILDYDTDLVIAAITGSIGLMPVVSTLRKGITLALANKESLVCSGMLVTKLAQKKNVKILPIDSEHNAIYQVLDYKNKSLVSKLILTASGGPFLNHNYEQLKNVTPNEAVKHPNWSMGKKISIDSATMMNKGLELIEAFFLFDIPQSQIEVLVHPESIIHSCVEYIDGSVLSQMGTPDMRTPISYTLAYPTRISTNVERLNLSKVGKLTFFPPSFDKFPCLSLAYESLKIQKSAPAILNAANEVAVEAFLNNKIKFISIPKIIEKTLNKTSFYDLNSIKEVIEVDKDARRYAEDLVKTGSY